MSLGGYCCHCFILLLLLDKHYFNARINLLGSILFQFIPTDFTENLVATKVVGFDGFFSF